jgi:hypothetical protein
MWILWSEVLEGTYTATRRRYAGALPPRQARVQGGGWTQGTCLGQEDGCWVDGRILESKYWENQHMEESLLGVKLLGNDPGVEYARLELAGLDLIAVKWQGSYHLHYFVQNSLDGEKW